MTTDTHIQHTDSALARFGQQLRLKRESLGLTIKDISAQLRLNEKVIDGLESNQDLSHFPLIFVRGYLRAYSKLLQIPADEIRATLEQMQSPIPIPVPIATKRQGLRRVAIHSHHVTQFGTSLIVLTVLSLFGIWWHTHTNNPSLALNKDITPVITEAVAPQNAPVATIMNQAQSDKTETDKTEMAHNTSQLTQDTASITATATHHTTHTSPSPASHQADDSEEDGDEAA